MTQSLLKGKPFALGALGADLTAVASSMQVGPNQGAYFPAIGATGNFHFYAAIIDENEVALNLYDRSEIVKVTVRAVDVFSTILRAQGGTLARAFPITPGNPRAKIRVVCGFSYENLLGILTEGVDDIIINNHQALGQATAPVLTFNSPKVIVLTPVAPITQNLPTANVKRGTIFKFYNQGTPANTATIKASAGGTVLVLAGGGLGVELCAMIDNPTLPADWCSPTAATTSSTLNNPIINGSLQDNPLPFGKKLVLRGVSRTVSSYTTGVGGLITASGAHQFVDGDAFRITAGSPPTGLTLNVTYFARVTGGAATTKFAVAPTLADALAGTNLINLTGAVTGGTIQPGYSLPLLKTKIYVEACIGGGGPGGSASDDTVNPAAGGGGGGGGIARGFKTGVPGNFFTWIIGPINGGNSIFINGDFYGYVSTTISSVSSGADTITPTANPHNLVEGESICFTAGSLPAPLSLGTPYYIRNPVVGGLNTIQLALTPGGAVIDITTTTSGATLQPGLVGLGGFGGGSGAGGTAGGGGAGGLASGSTLPYDNIRGPFGITGDAGGNAPNSGAGGGGGSSIYGAGGVGAVQGGGGGAIDFPLGMGGGGGGARTFAGAGNFGGGNGATGGLILFE
jgi:hypothetical protein